MNPQLILPLAPLGTFFVGFVFELTGWILYALMGLGGILLFFIGLWVGRRGAPSY